MLQPAHAHSSVCKLSEQHCLGLSLCVKVNALMYGAIDAVMGFVNCSKASCSYLQASDQAQIVPRL